MQPDPMNFLETYRLFFRVHQPLDEPDFVAMHTDPEVRRFVGGSAWPAEKAVERFRSQYLGQPSHTYGLWATVLKSEHRFIGSCGLRAPDGQHPPSLAFYLARPYWGCGLACEAARAFVGWAFGRLNLDRLAAEVQEGHQASVHILSKLGFRLVSRETIPASSRTICHYELVNPHGPRSQW
jgi:[ribosomal protein S5]-alanine N-acetyltransferase